MAEHLFAVGLIHLLALLSPGPDFSVLLKVSLAHARSRTVFCALGLTLGVLVHLVCTLGGLSALLAANTRLYQLLQIAGAGYLLYLGGKILVSTWRKQPLQDSCVGAEPQSFSLMQALRLGFITNVLNPKAVVYFVALTSRVLPSSAEFSAKVSFAAVILGLTWITFTLIGLLFTHRSAKKSYFRFSKWIDRALGALLVGFAVQIALFV